MKKWNWILRCPGIGDASNPVVTQIPSAVFEIIAEVMLSKSLVGGWRVIAPELLVFSVCTKNGNFILNLNHKDRMRLRVNFLDVTHKGAESGDFTIDNRAVIVRDGVMVRNSITVNGARICLFVGDNVHRRIEFAGEVAIYRSIPARVMTKPVQYQLQVISFCH